MIHIFYSVETEEQKKKRERKAAKNKNRENNLAKRAQESLDRKNRRKK
jgi:hypothetical protein